MICMLLCSFSNSYAQTSGYHLMDTYHVSGEGGWDYIAADPLSARLFVSHGTQVNVLNKKTGDSLGVITNTPGVHGIAVVHDLNEGFTSNGKSNNVTVFDLNTYAVKAQIPTGENPDAIFYDDFSKKVITCNGRSNTLSVIDPASRKVIETIPVDGKPETAVSNGKGMIYVNIEDKSEIAVVDISHSKVTANWPIAPGEEPTGLSIDRETNRLFAGCGNKLLIVVDASDGHVIDKIPIGSGCDGTGFDPSLKYIFASCGEGVLAIIQEVSADKFTLLDTVITKRGARTISVDTSDHSVYLPTAEFEATAVAGQRPAIVKGSFQVLVFKRK